LEDFEHPAAKIREALAALAKVGQAIGAWSHESDCLPSPVTDLLLSARTPPGFFPEHCDPVSCL